MGIERSKNTRPRTTSLEMEHHGTALASHSLLAEEVFLESNLEMESFLSPVPDDHLSQMLYGVGIFALQDWLKSMVYFGSV